MQTIAEFLREYMKENGHSFQTLGDATGVSRSYVQRVVNSPKYSVPMTFLKSLNKILSPKDKKKLEKTLTDLIIAELNDDES